MLIISRLVIETTHIKPIQSWWCTHSSLQKKNHQQFERYQRYNKQLFYHVS